ncbi:MAG: T9SS type A sorting domain-containing protein [candidate division WOR-3 bacterium]
MKNLITFLGLTVAVCGAGVNGAGFSLPQDDWSGILNLSDDAVVQYMGYGYQHTVATDTGGNVHVVWYDNRTGINQVFYRKWSRSTGSWGPVIQVTNQSVPVYRPAIACDYSGNVHIVWYHSTTNYYGIWYKKWNVTTGTWEDSMRIYDPGGNYLNYYPAIATRPGGDNVHVVWYGRDNANPSNHRVKHMEYIPGSGWGTVTIVDTMPNGVTEVASVTVDRWDSVYVVWRTQVSGNYQVFYRWRNGSGLWRNIEQVSNVNPNVSMYACAIAVDSSGSQVHVVWNGDTPGNSNDRIFYRSRTSAGWDSTEIVSTYGNGSQYDPVVVVGSDGAVHVVWRGYTEISTVRQEVLYRAKRNGVWGEVMQLTNRSSGSSVLTPALAGGGFDDIHIAWYDNTDGDNDVYYIRGEQVDPGVEQILAPLGGMAPGTTVIPTVVWRNYSPYYQADFRAFCFLINPGGARVYQESVDVVLGANRADTIVFPGLVVNNTGTWTVRCSTSAVLDKNSTNDVMEASFIVYNTDIQMFQIQAPNGTIDTGSVVTPRGRWWNRSANPADFTAYFQLFNPSGVLVYRETLFVTNLPGHQDVILNFPSFRISGPAGTWQARCSTFCLSDTFAENDTLSITFIVRALPQWPFGWKEVKSMPLYPSNKGPGDGAWLTQLKFGGNRYIFALKGNKTGDFYLYDPIADTWHQLRPIPLGVEQKPPRRGSVGVAGGDYIYATKGNNTLGFWRYNVELDSWEQLNDVPVGSGKRVKVGTDMVYIKRPHVDTGYVYLLKGYTDEFYRYNTITGQWETLAPAPLTLTGRRWDRGSWLIYRKEGQNYYIYAHKSKYHELWRYDVLGDSWFSQQLKGMPYPSRLTGKSKKAKDGSAGAYYNDAIYALKGGNTCEFWRYDVLGDSWVEMDTMPSVGSLGKKKRVKGGGDIVLFEDGAFFALKGGKSPELWRYYLADTLFMSTPSRAEVMGNIASPGADNIEFGPNPVVNRLLIMQLSTPKGARVQIYDVSGRSILSTFVSGRTVILPLEKLNPGVYVVKVIATEGRTITRKLVLE